MKPAAAAILAISIFLAACTPYPVYVAQAPVSLVADRGRLDECALIRGEIIRQQRIAQSSGVMATALVEASVRLLVEDVTVRPITPEIAALAAQFPNDYSGDPSDRLIGATARAEGLTLITRDEKIRRSPLLKTVW